ncbi:unnamed protein product [Lymnaea stagnalis]|uniref:Transmembrane protein 70 n=1 Tax=Lymnaea stagnalis TaxID=6523 RepID=A0AAV2HL07_LYMST
MAFLTSLLNKSLQRTQSFKVGLQSLSRVLCSPSASMCSLTCKKSFLTFEHPLKVSQFITDNRTHSSTNRGLTNNLIRHRKFSSHNENKTHGDLVYQGRVGNMFRALKIFSLSTSVIGLSLQPYIMITYQDMPLKAAIPFFAVINMFVFVNPILIHFIAKKYVMELYFNQENKVFTAVLLTFFARKEIFTFTANDVTVPDVPNMFAMLIAKGRPIFVLENDFTDMEVYKHLMGFDKPLDLSSITKD